MLADARLPNPVPQRDVTATASQSIQKTTATVDDNTTDIRLYNVDVSFGDKSTPSSHPHFPTQDTRDGL